MGSISWQAVSEVVLGHILIDKLPHQGVTVDMLAPPCDEALFHIKKKRTSDPTRIAEIVGLPVVSAALEAAQETEHLPLEWDTLLLRAASRANTGRIMAGISKRLLQGEDVDCSPVLNSIVNMDADQQRLIRLDTIEPEKHIWVPTYFPPIDYHLGGMMKAFVTVVGAPPGVGKTSFLAQIAIHKAKAGETVVIFSLEMTARYLLTRMLDMAKLTKKVRRNIWVCEEIIPVDQVVAIASRKAVDGVDFIGVDFADLMILGEESEQKMSAVYKGLSALSKYLQTPTMLISQLNRKYVGGIPKMHNLRYSGMAEALCGGVWFIHNPFNVMTDEINERDSRIFPPLRGYGYILICKSKGGFGKYDSPGGIQVKWNGLTGWGGGDGVWLPAQGSL